MSIGLFLIALSFAASRDNNSHANVLYWIGEVTFFAVPATYLLSRRPSKRQSTILAFAAPLLSYAITESYSPIQFRFLDEFQHVQTAQAILQTHHLFTGNTTLPVSPYFPGLEIATTALAQLSHLSVYASGTIVVGVVHLLTAVGLYLLVMEIYNRPRIAALSVIIYATEPHYQFFDSYFTYETMAMPFLIACLLAYVKMMHAPVTRTRAIWLGLAVFCGAVTAVSHHITSYVLLAFLIVLTIGEGARRRLAQARAVVVRCTFRRRSRTYRGMGPGIRPWRSQVSGSGGARRHGHIQCRDAAVGGWQSAESNRDRRQCSEARCAGRICIDGGAYGARVSGHMVRLAEPTNSDAQASQRVHTLGWQRLRGDPIEGRSHRRQRVGGPVVLLRHDPWFSGVRVRTALALRPTFNRIDCSE